MRLRESEVRLIRARFGVVVERLVYELRGIPCLALEDIAPPKQQIIASRSFGKPVTALDELKQAVAMHVTRAAVKLRRQGSEARSLQIFLSTNPFVPDDPQYHHTGTLELPAPTADTGLLIGQAMTTLRNGRLSTTVGHAPGTAVAGLYHTVVGRAGGEIVPAVGGGPV